jgi:hypothetical protein
MYRALAVWLVDVEGVNVCQFTSIGASASDVLMLARSVPASAGVAYDYPYT